MTKLVTHSEPSNWTPHEHELVKEALKKYGTEFGQIVRLGDALDFAEKNGASKRVLDSIRSRAHL